MVQLVNHILLAIVNATEELHTQWSDAVLHRHERHPTWWTNIEMRITHRSLLAASAIIMDFIRINHPETYEVIIMGYDINRIKSHPNTRR